MGLRHRLEHSDTPRLGLRGGAPADADQEIPRGHPLVRVLRELIVNGVSLLPKHGPQQQQLGAAPTRVDTAWPPTTASRRPTR